MLQAAPDGERCYRGRRKLALWALDQRKILEEMCIKAGIPIQRHILYESYEAFMDENSYSCSGGGFPVRVEDAGLVAVITVSGLNHVQDHDFIVKTLSKYLHINEVPRISGSDVQ